MDSLERVSALGTTDDRGREMKFSGLSVSEYRPKSIMQLNGALNADDLEVVMSRLGFPRGDFETGKAYRSGNSTVLWNGPGMWMLVSDEQDSGSMVADLNAALSATDATATDLSHSRTVLRLSGEILLDFLATGCPMDLEHCEPGTSASTQFGHFNVLIHLVDQSNADIFVYRSFGQALWEHCHHAGEEFN